MNLYHSMIGSWKCFLLADLSLFIGLIYDCSRFLFGFLISVGIYRWTARRRILECHRICWLDNHDYQDWCRVWRSGCISGCHCFERSSDELICPKSVRLRTILLDLVVADRLCSFFRPRNHASALYSQTWRCSSSCWFLLRFHLFDLNFDFTHFTHRSRRVVDCESAEYFHRQSLFVPGLGVSRCFCSCQSILAIAACSGSAPWRASQCPPRHRRWARSGPRWVPGCAPYTCANS